jgi:hypothetical protein
VPWSVLCALIEPFYPKPGNGRPPVGVERMLRIYFLQQWFNLSDPAVEEALYDSRAMRDFVGIATRQKRHLVARIDRLAARSGRYRRGGPVPDSGQLPCHSKRTKIAVTTSRSSGTE